MEFFKQVNLDWMGKAKYFFALSAALLLIGAISIISKGGLNYGIDFKGGTLVDVRFAGAPPVDQLIKTGQRFLVSSMIFWNTSFDHVGMPSSVRAWMCTIAAPAS